MSSSDVNEWDVSAVESWVSSLGPEFKKHSSLFGSNDINGRRLLKLTDEKLEKMGIASLGVRDDIVEAIQKLAKGGPAPVIPDPSQGKGTSPAPNTAASPAPQSTATPFDQKKALEAFVENAKALLKVMKEGSATDVVAASTNLVKSVRLVLDHPDLQGKLSDESRAAVISTLGVLISNAKLVAVGDQTAKNDMQAAVPSLIRSVNQIFLPPAQAAAPAPAPVPKVVPQAAPKPMVPIKPAATSSLAPPAVGGLKIVPTTGAKPGPMSPFAGGSGSSVATPPPQASPSPSPSPSPSLAPAPVASPISSPAGSFRALPASAGGFLELVVAIYSSITDVTQMIKNNMDQQHLVDKIVKVITGITKLLKEGDSSGGTLVDQYSKREVLVHHSTTIAQEVKAITGGRSGGEYLTLKTALKAISNATMELLTDCIRDQKVSLKCPVCSKNATEDSILCEGPDSCGRWFHRECVGLYSGSFFHTGWTCGVIPCKAKLKEAERVEAEKRQAKEEALLQRQKEAKEIADQKKKWEEEIAAQKKREEDKLRAIEEQAEREKQERLQKIKNMDLESAKLEEEYKRMNEESLASTGLTIEQLNVVSRWQPKVEKDEEEGAVIPREKKEPKLAASAGGDVTPVINPAIPVVKSVRMSSLLEDSEDIQVICKVRAVYDYDPIGGDGQDLRFKTGDVIDVIKKQKDGWWEGVLDGYVGFFYSSFVQEVADDGSVKQGQQQPLVITHAPGMKKKAGGTGFEAPVPKITLGDLSDPDYDGWLWKEGNRKNWKKQWFVLKDFCLYFFENNKYDANALGLILIPGYTIAPHQDPKREHTFTCEHASARTYFLAGETKQDATLWIDTLNRASVAKTWNEEGPNAAGGVSKRKPNKPETQTPDSTKSALADELKVAVQRDTPSQEDLAGASSQENVGATPPKPERPAPKPKPQNVVPPEGGSLTPTTPVGEVMSPVSPKPDRKAFKGSVRGGSSRGGGNIKVPVPNVVVKDLKGASHSGWLLKQGFNNKAWKKRWFVLEGFCLYYFETAKNDSKALGMVMLPSYNVLEVPSAVANRAHCFDLVHPSARCYSLSAESEGIKEDWMEKLNAATTMI